MNVAIISPEFPPLTNWGGIATFNDNLAKILNRLGHRVTVFTLDETTKKEYVAYRGNIEIVYIPGNFQNRILNFIYFIFPFGIPRKFFQRFFPTLLFSLEWNFFCLLAFSKHIRHTPIGIIHTPVYHIPAIAILLWYKHIPLILHSQGPQELLNQFEPKTLDSVVKAAIENLYIKYVGNHIIACSLNVQQYLIHKYPYLQKKITYIPNFIDTKNNPIRHTTFSYNKWIFIGRFEYRKGIDLVVQAFMQEAKKNPALMLYLVGKAGDTWNLYGRLVSFQTWLTALHIADSIKERIILVPQINDAYKLSIFLQRHKGIAILPSRYEPFGFVYLECMLNQCVTLASTSGGGAEIIIDGKNGFLIKPTITSICTHVKKINRFDQNTIKQILATAQQTVHNRFNTTAVMSQYKLLYQNYRKK